MDTELPVSRAGQDAEVARLYERLRSIARRQRRQHGEAWTLDTTALVHEAWVQLEEGAERRLSPRDYHAYAARAMRNLLIDHARRRLRPKHGGDLAQVDLEDEQVLALPAMSAEQLLDLDEALAVLDIEHPRVARVVMLHYFAGLDFDRIAAELDLSTRTVMRDWRFARAWLHQRLQTGD
ncbi:MAG: ECF-type sigma factor [Chiayiivirga sp.]|jgi:RNA polymerase sigma factor (TIGR02999 family)|uniref:ECF-type sigma factor n=1 Tax=Chiayiivirga sp. TaxID=2041042 RepID=UPI0025C48655|nr:ECF-type sigma factor [Chiayiivirga sp.]MCI1730377.1 ECF-type sigma factor [Chiayiivirga sp.]